MPEGKGTYGSKIGRPKKNPGDVQRESASKRKKEELKNKSKWKSTPNRPKTKPPSNWMERRRGDPKDYFLNKIIPAGGIAGGAKKLVDLLKKSGAGYSGSGDYKE